MRVTLNENPRLEYLREKTLRLTSSPGCYIMKNKSGNTIYIGKAKNLRNRVSPISTTTTTFQRSRKWSPTSMTTSLS